MGGRVVRESLEVGDEEGRDGKLLLLPGEPQLVAAIPRQRVEVGEEGGLLHVLPQGNPLYIRVLGVKALVYILL